MGSSGLFSGPIRLAALAEAIGRIEGGYGDARRRRHIATGSALLDRRLPGGGLAAGAVHELYSGDAGGGAWTAAAWLAARAAAGGGFILWFDSCRDLNPPAAAGRGIDLERLVVVRPRDRGEMLWGMGRSLRCRGVSAVVGSVGRLSLLEARRLQLAAESGGGVGLLLCRGASMRAAGGVASRWRLTGLAGRGAVQRFGLEIEKCRGGRPVGGLVLEFSRDQGVVVVSAELGDRPGSSSVAGVAAG